MNKIPTDTQVYDFAQLMAMADSVGWPLKAHDIEHAFVFDNIDEIFALFTDQVLMQQASEAGGLTEELEQIFYEWPAARTGVLNLALYLTRIFPSADGTPLLDVCIKSAVDQYKKVSFKMFEEGVINLQLQMQAFIVGLTRPIPEILTHTMYGEQGAGDWYAWPALSEPIFDWVMRNSLKRVMLVPSPIVSNEDALLARIQVTHTIFGYQTLKRAHLDWKTIIQLETYN